MKYEWLLFDADDTLFDFSKAESNALKWTLEQSGLPYQDAYLQLYTRFNQMVWQEFERGTLTSQQLRVRRFQLFFEDIGFHGDPNSISALYLSNLALGTDLFDGASQVVHTLKKQFRLALVTNGLKDVQHPRLEHSELKDCFEKVFISEEIGVAKPDRGFFDAVFTAINHPDPQKVLIIGDSLSSDMQGGISYGIHTCWYNPRAKTTGLPVTYQIQSLRELPALV
jgi:2-haloacid dehalogenase